MTARDPADRPLPAEAAEQMSLISRGGQATTVLAARPPVAERTQVLSQTRATPAPVTASPRPASRPLAAAAPPRNNWGWVLGLIAAVLLIGVAALFLTQDSGGTTGPLPAVDVEIPQPLRGDLEQLQQEVSS